MLHGARLYPAANTVMPRRGTSPTSRSRHPLAARGPISSGWWKKSLTARIGALTAALLRVESIETFYGPIQAIRGVSLEVAPGQIVTVLGANGAGKTTVLRTVSGILDPEVGKVVFEGRDIAHMAPDQVMRMGICHVPEGREVFPFLTVRENLMMGSYTRRDTEG